MMNLTTSQLLECLCAQETWRDIEEYPGYRVSSWGRVSGIRCDILAPAEAHGYLFISLCKDGKVHNVRVHRLVATAFLGLPPFADAHAAHNDGDSRNNRATNLRWTNALDNQADVERHGNRKKGSEVHMSKLHEADIPIIRARVACGERYDAIAASFGVSKCTISLIKLGKIWRHV